MRPPLRWFGSKTRMAPLIVAQLPPHEHYIECFAGSAAVLFAKPRSRLETLNDLDGDIVNFYDVLRDPEAADALVRAVELTPYSRVEFGRARRINERPADAVERARAFLVRSHQAVGNAGQGWSYSVSATAVTAARSHRWRNLPARITAAADRLQGVQVESLDWREILTRYDGDGAVIYLDPPYHPDVRPNTMGCYAHEMTAADHEALVEAAIGLKHAAAIMSHYPHPLYAELEGAGWQRIDFTMHADDPNARRQVVRTEVLWISHPVQMRLGFGAA